MVAQALIPALRGDKRQVDLYGFETSLVYIERPCLKRKKKKEKKKREKEKEGIIKVK